MIKEIEEDFIKNPYYATLWKHIYKLEKELYQQKFNNKHNLSIDQKISDEIERLRKVNKELESDNEELRHMIRTLTQEL